jgi:subtilisin family serine protease
VKLFSPKRRDRWLRLPLTAVPRPRAAALSETYDWAMRDDGIPELWKETKGKGAGGKGVKIWVGDSGVMESHPDLEGQVATATDFTGSRIGSRDQHGHGTFVTGQLVAKAGNDQGVAGICYEAELHHGKVLNDFGAGEERWIGRGFQSGFDLGCRIFSCSFGGFGMSQWLYGLLRELCLAGAIMFFAAGNNGGRVNEPADWPWGISVGASDERGMLTSFTSTIGRVDIVCPGTERLSTIPGGGYGSMTGTSMATPHGAGVGVLAVAKHSLVGGDSELKNRDDMIEHLQATAADRGTYKLLNPRKVLERIKRRQSSDGQPDGQLPVVEQPWLKWFDLPGWLSTTDNVAVCRQRRLS